MLTLVGAGAVGLSIAARLIRGGCELRVVVRRPEVAAVLEQDGIRVEDPASGDSWSVPVAVCSGLASTTGFDGGPVLLCVRATETRSVARTLAQVAPGATAVSVQNHLGNEAELARHFPRVLGVVFRQTCTRRGPGTVAFTGAGRVVVGAHPAGGGHDVDALAAEFRRAGFDVGVSELLEEDRRLKLCVNLMSAPNALVRREDHTTLDFVEVKARLLEEAEAVLAAAGLIARSCDGRDRSLADEIVAQREAFRSGTSARPIPLYNQVWAALRNGGPLEADRYHRYILDLAAEVGIETPVNTRVLEVLERVYDRGLGPETVGIGDLLPLD